MPQQSSLPRNLVDTATILIRPFGHVRPLTEMTGQARRPHNPSTEVAGEYPAT